MKMLFLLQDVPYPITNGVRVKVYNLISYMSRQYECHILSFGDTDLQSRALEFQKKVPGVKIIDLYPICSGLMLQLRRLVHFVRGEPLFLARWWNKDFSEAVRHTLKDDKYDVIHIDALGMAPYVRLCRSLPTVISTTDAMSLVYIHAAEASRSFLGKAYRLFEARSVLRFERKMLPLFSMVHVVSQPDRDCISSHVPGVDVEFIEHVVPDEVLQFPDITPCANRILFTGVLNSDSIARGLDAFLSIVYPVIYRKYPKVDMIILGRNAPAKLKNIIRQVPGVRLLEWVEDYLAELMKAQVLVFPDWSGTGVKTRVLYALGLGKAVVATPVALQGIEVKDGEHCFIRDVGPEFTDALMQLLIDTEMRQTIEYNAKKLIISKYNIEITGPKWIRLYESAIIKNKRKLCAEKAN